MHPLKAAACMYFQRWLRSASGEAILDSAQSSWQTCKAAMLCPLQHLHRRPCHPTTAASKHVTSRCSPLLHTQHTFCTAAWPSRLPAVSWRYFAFCPACCARCGLASRPEFVLLQSARDCTAAWPGSCASGLPCAAVTAHVTLVISIWTW